MKFLSPEKYQPKTNEVFKTIKQLISTELINAQVEHIGSSSIDGAISKGDLDVYVGVNSNEFYQATEVLKGLGFKIKEDTFRSHELCMFQCFDYDLDVGIQLVDKFSRHTDFLLFRNALLNNPALVGEYNQLKMAAVGLTDAQYREKKTAFINAVLAEGTIYRLNQRELSYWRYFLKSLKQRPINPNVHAAVAGKDKIADELLELYLSGRKTAGSSLLRDYEVTGDDLPKVGNYWIILDSNKNSRCIVRTTKVEHYQFDQVPKMVAEAEGEGDLSLVYWRKAHINFFTPFLSQWGVTDLDKGTLITEFFEVVYRGNSI